MHRLTLWGQWAVQLMQCTPTLPGGGGQWNSCNARAHELGDGESCPGSGRCSNSGTRACTPTLPRGSGQWTSCNVRAHQLGARGGMPRRWSLPKERCSCNALPHYLGVVGSAILAMHCPKAID